MAILDNDCEKILAMLSAKGIKAKIHKINDAPVTRRVILDLVDKANISKIYKIDSKDFARILGVKHVKWVYVYGCDFCHGIEYARKERFDWDVQFDDIEVFRAGPSKDFGMELPIIIGKSYSKNPIIKDLVHDGCILLADRYGQSKEGFFDTAIVGLAHKYTSDEVKFALVDSKDAIFAKFEKLPHLHMPIATSHREAVAAMKLLDL